MVARFGRLLVRRIIGGNAPPDRTEETAMHAPISDDLAQARIADLRQHAHRAALARAVPPARAGPRGRAAPLLAAVGRRVRRRPALRTEQALVAGLGETPPVPTPRELDVLELVAQGLTNPGIATPTGG
jgi:DNA-binding NarL/FixJ family response regulator